MRQAGIIAAPAIYALEHNIPRLQEGHDNCATCAAQLQNLKKVIVQKDVQTNILMLDVAQTGITPPGILCPRQSQRAVDPAHHQHFSPSCFL